jgi:hypothetical protein
MKFGNLPHEDKDDFETLHDEFIHTLNYIDRIMIATQEY